MPPCQNITPLVSPRGIAVIGASEKPGAGSLVIQNLKRLGYKGDIVPINAKYEQVLGHRCYPSLAVVPANVRVDTAAILLGSHLVIPLLAQVAERDIPTAWAFASGFAETGTEGGKLQKEVAAFCAQNHIRLCGPNCTGVVNFNDNVALFSAPLPRDIRSGDIGVVAQSGAVLLAMANIRRDIGYSKLLASGNEADLGLVDYLQYLVDDPHTAVIAAFIESIREPQAFSGVCERAAAIGKPIVALKVGKSDMARKVAATHTGAIAGEDRILDAFLRKVGVIRVDSLDQLIETSLALRTLKDCLPKGDRVGMTTVSGGELGMVADIAADLNVAFPPLSTATRDALQGIMPSYTPISNPLDAWGSGDLVKAYPAALKAMAADDNFDFMAVSQDMPGNMAEVQVDQFMAVARAAAAARKEHGKPVALFSNISGGMDSSMALFLEENGVPTLQGTREGLTAIRQVMQYARFQRTRAALVPAPPLSDALRDRVRQCSGILPYGLSVSLLDHFGIPVPHERLCQDWDQVRQAAKELAWPLVLKVASAAIPHKSETGLVQLNLHSEGALEEAYQLLQARLKQHHPGVTIEGFLLQAMVTGDAVETLVGVGSQPGFGPALVFGLGGVFVELLQDTSLCMAPLSHGEAEAMVANIQGKKLLDGYRGTAPKDVRALTDLLERLGNLAHALRNVLVSIDLNPVMVLNAGEGFRIVDIVIEVA